MAAKRSGKGTTSHPIGACGNGPAPIISGSDRITDWTEVGKHVYRKAWIDTEPYVALFNGRQLKRRKGAKGNVGPDEFDWDSDTLYANVGASPDTVRSRPGNESIASSPTGRTRCGSMSPTRRSSQSTR